MTVNLEKFCSQCGMSLVPLDIPYLSKECESCHKTAYYVRHDVESGGIKIEKGESFTIPKGFIQLSLDPTLRGKLFRPGLPFLLNRMFHSSSPKLPEDISDCTSSLKELSEKIVDESELLEGLDLEDEEDGNRAYEILKANNHSREWHAMSMGVFSDIAKEAMKEKDAQKAAWAGYMLGTTRGLTLVTEHLFENTLWQGYLANQVVYEAAAASMKTPGEAEAIRKLEPLFRRIDEATLHAWVESGLPIGPRIGIKNLPEEILVPLAKWHLASLQKKKEGEGKAKNTSRAEWEYRVKWLALGISAAGLVVAAIKLLGG